MLDIIIVGAGGCGREILEMAETVFSSEDFRIKGFLSDDKTILDKFPEVRKKAAIIDTITDYEVKKKDRFLLAVGDIFGRRRVTENLLKKGGEFISLIHPTAQIFRTAKLGKGVIVYPFALISSNVQIGDFCMLNAYSGCGHDAVIGKFSVLCPYASVLGAGVTGENCFLSTHAMLAPRKKIGRNAVISANSAALRDAPDDAFIYGVPGKNM